MKKGKILVAVLAVMSTYSAVRAEDGTIENLTETSGKISTVDMEKNPGEAGIIFNGFYSGAKAGKGAESSVVYMDNAPRASAVSGKSVCNAEAKKIGRLSSSVPPLGSGSGEGTEKSSLPIAAGALAVGSIAFGMAGKKTGVSKGYFDHYSDDVHTVIDYVTGGGSSSGNSVQQPSSNHTAVGVDNSSGTVTTSTTTDNSCASSSTACNGGAWLDSQLPHYHKN